MELENMMRNDKNELLTKIDKLMKERNMSLYKLAQESGIPYSSLNSMMNKNNLPTIATLEKICQGLRISLSEFFSDYPPYREPINNYADDEKQLIEKYRQLTKKNQQLISSFEELLISHQ